MPVPSSTTARVRVLFVLCLLLVSGARHASAQAGLPAEKVRQIEALVSAEMAKQFREEGFYPGAPSEEIRQSAEHAVNAMLERLHAGLSSSPQKSYVISEFLEMLKAFHRAEPRS